MGSAAPNTSPQHPLYPMKKQILIACLFALCAGACTNAEKTRSPEKVIDIQGNLSKLTKLKASDFGKTIRYVPLETTDESLVGANPAIKVLKNHIMVTSQKRCMLFDKETGRFISLIGHFGEDPEGYINANGHVDEREGLIYFRRQQGELIKYDMKGNFKGNIKTTLPEWDQVLFTDSTIILYQNDTFRPTNTVMHLLNREWELQDSIPSIFESAGLGMGDLRAINVHKPTGHGIMGKQGLMTLQYHNGEEQIAAITNNVMWENEGEVHFKENHVDTLYKLANNRLTTFVTFNTGSMHRPAEERTTLDNIAKRMLMGHVSEKNNQIFFQCILGVLTENVALYSGLYNKETEELKLMKGELKADDDLSNLMPFEPVQVSTANEYIGILQVDDIMTWLEEQPEANREDMPPFLKDFNEDMNPVVVIVE